MGSPVLIEPPISTENRVEKDVGATKLNVITAPATLLGWLVGFLTSSPARLPAVRAHSHSQAAKRIAVLWEEVERMKLLDVDWNGYGSEPPNSDAMDLAKTVLLSATAVLLPTRVTPSAQGGVGICFYRGTKYGDIECLNTGEILATISEGSGTPQVWEVKLSESKGALKRIGQFLNS